jgi:hypothetical protein
MPLNVTGRNALLTSGAPGLTYIGALTALTPTEVAGGSYAAQAVTWAAAASGIRDNNAQISIPIPAGTTVIALCTKDGLAGTICSVDPYGSSGQTLKGMATVTASTDLFATGVTHGLTTDDRVYFAADAGNAIPTGISTTTLYYVLASGLTTTAFKISTSSGGAALDVTADGQCAWFKTVPNTFASAGNIVIATGDYDVDLNFI